ISVISGLTLFYNFLGNDGFAWGVVLGAITQVAVLLPSVLKNGFRFSLNFGRSILEKVRRTLLLTVPRTFGLLADKLNLVVMVALASTISEGSVRIFSSAFDIATVVTGLIGISFATAVFPKLSKSVKENQISKENFLKYFSQVFLQILFWSLAASVVFLMLRIYIVRVIAGYGQCDWDCTQVTAATVGVFSLSLFAQSLIPLLSRVFFALKNTIIPVTIGIIGNAINISLALYFINLAKNNDVFYFSLKTILKLTRIQEPEAAIVVVLALAFSFAALVQFIILWMTLDVKLNGALMSEISRSWIKMIVASAAMLPAIYFSLRIFDLPFKTLFPGKTVIPLFLQGFSAGVIGILVYILVAKALKIKPVRDLEAILNKKIF
ncbi:MAG: lipid II flippase MurJ, partial [candidate division WOR-3 bacterium]